MRHNGYNSDGGHPSYDVVLKSAIRRAEPLMHIMLDPKTQRYHEIRPCGFEWWSKSYKLIANVRFVPDVEVVAEP